MFPHCGSHCTHKESQSEDAAAPQTGRAERKSEEQVQCPDQTETKANTTSKLLGDMNHCLVFKIR